MKQTQFETRNRYYCFFHAVERVNQYIQEDGKTAGDAPDIVAYTTKRDISCVHCHAEDIERRREIVAGIFDY